MYGAMTPIKLHSNIWTSNEHLFKPLRIVTNRNGDIPRGDKSGQSYTEGPNGPKRMECLINNPNSLTLERSSIVSSAIVS